MTVGHRALVARTRADGRYDLYRSQWGAHEWRLAAALGDGTSDGELDGPVATDCSFETIVTDHVDFRTHEALFVVADDTVRPYLVCWFGLPGVDGSTSRTGALVGVETGRSALDGEYLRGWFAGVKATVLALVADDHLDPATARAMLVLRVESLTDERRVHFGPAARSSG